MKRFLVLAVVLLLMCASAVMLGSCSEKAKDAKEETTKVEATTEKEETKAPETTKAEPEAEKPAEEPEFVNPLTGLESSVDLSKKRPVSIMVNNIYVSLPQVGVSQADILYECLAEGGITRLMMISTEYEKLSKVGSVRSARDYYIDYANGYDCIFLHAGGSTYAYNTLAQRGTDRIDGVNGPAYLFNGTGTFLRDPERLAKYSYEHTLVVQSGKGIEEARKYYNYRTEKTAGYEKPMNFAEFGKTTVLKNEASHVKVVMSNYQTVDFVYNKENGKYLRYQYNGEPHIDSANGEQLAFENVVLVFTTTSAIPGDDKARITVGTTGSGEGYYITEGTYEKIKWKKENYSSVLKFYREDGTEVEMNRGKTMINVVPTNNASLVKFDNEWKDK